MTIAVLALDLSSKTGWATLDEAGTMASGVQHFPLRRGESPGMRWLRFRRWLRELISLTCPAVIAVELPLVGAKGRVMGIGRELQTIVEEEAASRAIETTGLYPSQLKKHATGKGNASKPEMQAAAQERWGVKPADDNEADALCVLAWALEEIGQAALIAEHLRRQHG